MSSSSLLSKNLPPLSERMRPKRISEFIGQQKLINNNSLIIKTLKSNQLFSMIFWGPPGTGKTTLARILSHKYKSEYFSLSATSSGVQDIRKILQKGKENFDFGKRSILFIDEIHRFSKSQQDTLLHSIEDGTIILIGATTENPNFEVISPLLSRCRVMRLYPLGLNELSLILNRAINTDIILGKLNILLDSDAESLILESSRGDARIMLNTLELAVCLKQTKNKLIGKDDIIEAFQKKNILYDKRAQHHYDIISAYIKSMRGSDPDAAIYWLAIMLEGGERPEFIARRLIVFASEDIGNAEPYALQLATTAFEAIHKIGMPESHIILSQITIFLATASKSDSSYNAIKLARKYIIDHGSESVPIHLQNNNKDNIIDKRFSKNCVKKQNYFPDSFKKPIVFYKASNEGREKFIKERLSKIWKNRY